MTLFKPRYLSVSLVLHLLPFLLFLWVFKEEKSPPLHIIQAVTYAAPLEKSSQRIASTKTAISQQTLPKHGFNQNNKISKDDILTLLHNAIAEQQRYPDAALTLKQSGIAIVGFNLHTDGSITELKILHSSNVTSLDEAALSAVAHAAPFLEASKYLSVITHFVVNIGFEYDE